MKRPAVFFDRDNTLIVSDGYLGEPNRVTLVAGASEAVARARRAGYAVVVFSNQSGVARGMFSEEDVQAVNARMDELLIAENPGAVIDRHEFCPFHPEGTVDVYARESDRRKPKPGMILSAADKLALDLSRSWVVGDAGRDIEAGKAAGCRAILFADASLKKSPAAEGAPKVEPDYTVTTLAEALEYIERNAEVNANAEAASAAPMDQVAVAAATVQSGESERNEMPAPAPSVAPMSIASARRAAELKPEMETRTPPADQADTPTNGESTAAPSAPVGPRVPKVVIGSKYVPPAGKPIREPAVVPQREEIAEKPSPQRKAQRGEDESARPVSLPSTGFERMETTLEQIFLELRRQHEHHESDFSVSKLLAGVVQVLVLAVLFLAYLHRETAPQTYMMLALVLQTMTISLLIMSRQK
jgi:histidinol-phosphate phosphatase family protein